MVEVFLLRFRTPYIVRLHSPLEIVDSFTVLRALMDVASKAGFASVFDSIANGRLAASSILPAVRSNGCYRLLAPISAVPATPEKVLRELAFAPLHVIREAVLEPYSKLPERCLPLRVVLDGGKPGVRIRCGDRESSYPRYLFYSRSDLFRRVEETRSRIDRITAAADLYKIRAVMPLTELWIAFSEPVNEANLRSAIELLGMIGVGAAKSRGTGKFELADGEPCKEDVEALADLETLSRSFSSGPVMLLGSYIPQPEDSYSPSLSIVAPNRIYGSAGHAYNEYRMPMITAAGVGSILWLTKPAKPYVHELQVFEDFRPRLVFNPVVLMYAPRA